MNLVKEEQSESVKITPFERIPVPINPINPFNPFNPPYEVYCENKNSIK
jgi:hypothetical protein